MTLAVPQSQYCLTQLVCTESNSYFLTSEGQLYACGASTHGQCAGVEENTGEQIDYNDEDPRTEDQTKSTLKQRTTHQE